MLRRFFILTFLSVSMAAFAQPHPDSLIYKNIKWEYIENLKTDIDVNGVPLWTILTKEDIIEKFGVPDRYYNEDGRYDDDPDDQERGYYYGENYIETLNGEFLGFDIRDTRFKVLTKYFEGGIGVGSHISVFKGFKDGMLNQSDPKRFGKNCYQLIDAFEGYFCFRTDSDGYITYISYTFPV